MVTEVTQQQVNQFIRDMMPLAREGFRFDRRSEHVVLVTAPWRTQRYISFKSVLESRDPVRYVIDAMTGAR